MLDLTDRFNIVHQAYVNPLLHRTFEMQHCSTVGILQFIGYGAPHPTHFDPHHPTSSRFHPPRGKAQQIIGQLVPFPGYWKSLVPAPRGHSSALAWPSASCQERPVHRASCLSSRLRRIERGRLNILRFPVGLRVARGPVNFAMGKPGKLSDACRTLVQKRRRRGDFMEFQPSWSNFDPILPQRRRTSLLLSNVEVE